MKTFITTFFAFTLLCAASVSIAQSDDEELKIAAMEALITAPPERALPIVQRVLAGNGSDELKEKALFILSQIDAEAAQAALLQAANETSGELRLEAVRMIGIGGNAETMQALAGIYASGDMELKEAVLEAYMIADDVDSVFQIASTTDDPEEFEAAVEMLGVMGANDRLRELRSRNVNNDALVEAFMIAGDSETLLAMARDGSDIESQAEAIQALGVVGGDGMGAMLADIYRNAGHEDIQDAALEGLMIADEDGVIIELFRESDDPEQKREMLELLTAMDSDSVWEIIDQTLGED